MSKSWDMILVGRTYQGSEIPRKKKEKKYMKKNIFSVFEIIL